MVGHSNVRPCTRNAGRVARGDRRSRSAGPRGPVRRTPGEPRSRSFRSPVHVRASLRGRSRVRPQPRRPHPGVSPTRPRLRRLRRIRAMPGPSVWTPRSRSPADRVIAPEAAHHDRHPAGAGRARTGHARGQPTSRRLHDARGDRARELPLQPELHVLSVRFPGFVRMVASRWPQAGVNVSFVAPSTDLVPRTHALLPRYEDVLPLVGEGMRLGEAAGLTVDGFESMCGLPLCLGPRRSAAVRPAGHRRPRFEHRGVREARRVRVLCATNPLLRPQTGLRRTFRNRSPAPRSRSFIFYGPLYGPS